MVANSTGEAREADERGGRLGPLGNGMHGHYLVGAIRRAMAGIVATVRSLLLKVVNLVIFVVTLPLRLVKRLLQSV